MPTAQYWIRNLKLMPHPEGGYYKETYRSEEVIKDEALPKRFHGDRNFSTAIYFLLRSRDRSCFHRIKSDEIWHFHAGAALDIYVLEASGLTIHTLGSDPEKGESLQVVVPAKCWFGAKVRKSNSYTLAGCTVSPGFDFNDFEMANGNELLAEFPDYQDVITMLGATSHVSRSNP